MTKCKCRKEQGVSACIFSRTETTTPVLLNISHGMLCTITLSICVCGIGRGVCVLCRYMCRLHLHLHLADAFIQSDLQGCTHFTFTMLAHCTSGAIRGSVSCLRTLRQGVELTTFCLLN